MTANERIARHEALTEELTNEQRETIQNRLQISVSGLQTITPDLDRSIVQSRVENVIKQLLFIGKLIQQSGKPGELNARIGGVADPNAHLGGNRE